jgi:hypothetical protein
MKSPHLQLKEAIYEISKIAYETDDEFKEMEAQLEHYIEIRNHAAKGLDLPNSDEQRKELRDALDELDFVIERIREELRNYLEDYLEESRVKIEFLDQEKLDAAFEKARIAHERVYLVYKHTRPDLVEEFLRTAFETLNPDEREEFWQNVARRELDELDEILESVEADATALRP